MVENRTDRKKIKEIENGRKKCRKKCWKLVEKCQ